MAEKAEAEGKKEKEKEFKKYAPKKFCPKCGSGTHLAEHKNRRTCGRCGYTEMIQ
jgi:small subunit ribosomal protein S27Ae